MPRDDGDPRPPQHWEGMSPEEEKASRFPWQVPEFMFAAGMAVGAGLMGLAVWLTS